MDSPVIAHLKEHKDKIVELWMKKMDEAAAEAPQSNINYKALITTNETFAEVIYNYILNDGSSRNLNEFIGRILQFGWPLSYLTHGIQVFRRVVIEVIGGKAENTKELLQLYQQTDAIIDPISNKLIHDAAEQWENTVYLQKNALMELSAPLIPVMEKISVMPLIGTIDTERAKLIMENLLEGVIEHRSEVVLIDITGVPIVDTMVAHHIIQAAEAVRLVGAKCILVGIRPEIAQTIVNLGITLSDFPTRSTLKEGIETALKMTKREIVFIDQEGSD
ncbi:rsbT co-antagonist protein RsbR [Scopulibacillus daqui]|uniref:RsbT co-antagonist protein RsbR n=1 Tax=Scopulibacillus daqui TaxID=1469162 RepID=A0ABS2PXD9_9BACL|nr:rsbT co-antagonist protein RsbR [Scopulibacillus daqui]